MAAPVRIAPPGVSPVSLAEAKAHLRVDHAEDDAIIAVYLASAEALLDGWSGLLGRCLINQEWRFSRSGFPSSGVLDLPFPDVSAVSVAYFDLANASLTLGGASYRIESREGRSVLVLAEGASWPLTSTRSDAVTVTLTAGFGESAADVPAMIRQAIRIEVGDLYHRREGASKPSTYLDRVISTYGRAGIGAAFTRS